MGELLVRDADHFPRPLSPLCATTLYPALEDGVRATMEGLGVDTSSFLYEVRDGYAYTGWADASALQGSPDEDPTPRLREALDALPGRWDDEFLPRLRSVQDELRALADPTSEPETLAADLQRSRSLLDEAWRIHMEVVFPIRVGMQNLIGRLEGVVDDPEHHASRTLSGLSHEGAPLDRALLELGALVDDEPQLREALRRASPREAVEALQDHEGEAGERFRSLWPELAERATTLELIDPTWGEDPSPLVANLSGGREALRRFRDGLERSKRIREEAADAVAGKLPSGARKDFREDLARLRAAWPLKSEHNHHIDEVITGLTRLAYIRAGEALAGDGPLADPSEVVFLEADEVEAALRGQASLDGVAAERRRRWREARDRDPPTVMGDEDPALYEAPSVRLFMGVTPETETPDGLLEGVAGSPGQATGTARLVRSPRAPDGLEEGDVLVAPTTEPPWTPLFSRVSAVVTETGGVLCHAATVARERGIPAVVGVTDAMAALQNGDRVEVDGDEGTVRVLDQQP